MTRNGCVSATPFLCQNLNVHLRPLHIRTIRIIKNLTRLTNNHRIGIRILFWRYIQSRRQNLSTIQNPFRILPCNSNLKPHHIETHNQHQLKHIFLHTIVFLFVPTPVPRQTIIFTLGWGQPTLQLLHLIQNQYYNIQTLSIKTTSP